MKINKEREIIQKEAFEAIKKNNFNAAILLVTGGGKAKVMIDCILALKPKRIFYGADSTRNRDETFKKEMIKWGAEKYIKNTTFMCYQSAYKMKGEEFDLGLFDESDFSITEEYKKVYDNNTFKHKILVSATLDNEKRKLLKKIVPIVYEKDLKDVEGKGVVNDSRYYIVNYMLTSEENKKYLKYNAIFSAELNKPVRDEKKLTSLKIQRNLFLSRLGSSVIACKDLLRKLYKEEHRKILIFAGVASQADKLCKYSYHSHNKADHIYKDFDEGRIRVMSVVGKVDRGDNINGVNTEIFESPKASKTKWHQKSGRGRRLDVEEELDIFYLLPYYRDRNGVLKPTIVENWIYSSAGSLNIKPEIYKL